MNRAISALLLFFLLSLSFADFIDYENSYALPKMREYLQSNDDYYVTEDVEYDLNMELSIPSSESYRWLGGSGSYDDLRHGDIVCEGTFNYELEIEAWAIESSFFGRMYDFGAGSPATWPDCSSPGCPDGNVRVYWSESLYDSYYDSMQTSSKHLQNYASRQMSYRELENDPWSTNEESEISTVMLGTYMVSSGSTTLVGPYDMSGSTASRSGSFTLSSSSRTTYTLNERLDVDGALLGVYNPNIRGEYYNSFTSTYPGQDEYSRSNIHGSGDLRVYDESNVGVDAPQITLVDLYADGEFPDPEIITPGETIPVEIIMEIPAVGDDFYPLRFEFYDVQFSGPAGFTFTADDFGSQCSDSRMFIGLGQRNNNAPGMPGLGETEEITGYITVPSSLPDGEYEFTFRVDWRTCSDELDCNGDGRDSRTPPVTITTETEDGGDPDLVCTLEPASYSSADAVQDGQLLAGEGVETWEITITNNGDAPAIIPDSSARLCTAAVFGATDNEGGESPDTYPGYYAFFPNSNYPRTIEPGSSRTITVRDAPSSCSAQGGGSITAYAIPNSASTPMVYPSCGTHMIDEPQGNNRCEFEIPCADADDSCWCQVYPGYSNGHAGEEYDFITHCNTGDCEGTATWSLITGAPYGTITSSDIDGASVLLGNSIPSGQQVTVQATMDLGCSEPTVCSNTITVTEGELHYCTVTPSAYPDGSAGEEYDFTVSCDGGACVTPVFWTITEGEDAGEITSAIPSRATVGVFEDAEAGDRIRVNATTTIYGTDVTCSGIVRIVDSPKNCTCEPPEVNNAVAGEEYTFDVFCGGLPCEGGSAWEFTDPQPPRGTRFVDIGAWGATIQLSPDAGPGDEVHIHAQLTGEGMSCYCHLYTGTEEGTCEIELSTPADGLEPGDTADFTITCDGGPCPPQAGGFWEILSGNAVLLDSDEVGATLELGEGTVRLQASPPGFGTCEAEITAENNPDDDLLGCRIEPPQEYGYPGSHHEFELYCTYGNGDEEECSGDWMITDGSEWIEDGTFSAGGDGHFWADVDVLTSLWGADERVGIYAIANGDEGEEVSCEAEILLPSLNCLDFI
jgi:hypothetical protein